MNERNHLKESKEVLYSGTLGWVIIPDKKTQKLARELSLKFDGGSEYLVSTAHITLYHASLLDVPIELVEETSNTLSDFIGKKYSLDAIRPYGNKFLFWDVSKPFTEIRKAHDLILNDFPHYLSKNDVSAAKREELDLTEEELKNLEIYGHPLVADFFRPHITLLYKSAGVNLESYKIRQATIDDILFVEIGEYGSIKSIVLSTAQK